MQWFPVVSMVFDLKNVSFSYPGGRPGLASVSLEVSDGERVAILGPNGSGKSTLLKVMDGLLFPESGSMLFRGAPITKQILSNRKFNRSFRKSVGLVFQDPDVQLFTSSVREEVAFGPVQLELPDEEVAARVNNALAFLNIQGLGDRSPFQLSAGEKKKVAIASVLAVNPDVLLLDEPTADLDPRSVWEIVDVFEKLHMEKKTIVVSTLDLHVLPELADRVYVLDEGRTIRGSGPTKDILSDLELLHEANIIHMHKHGHDHTGHVHL